VKKERKNNTKTMNRKKKFGLQSHYRHGVKKEGKKKEVRKRL
jgi:hypothetical protein